MSAVCVHGKLSSAAICFQSKSKAIQAAFQVMTGSVKLGSACCGCLNVTEVQRGHVQHNTASQQPAPDQITAGESSQKDRASYSHPWSQ